MRILMASVVASMAVAGCSAGRAENAGPTVNRSFPVGDFTRLEVAGPFDVRVATGKAASVTASGPQELIERMEVAVEDGELRVRPEKKGWLNWGWNSGKAVVTVTVPALEAVRVAGSGDIDVDRVAGERFSSEIAGSGDLRLGAVQVKELKLAIAGSGSVQAAGQAEQASYKIAGSGDLDAGGVKTRRAEASIAGSGSIRANASDTASATINGSGDIEIGGGARCETAKHGSGDIRCS